MVTTESVSKTQVGEFLGEADQFNLDVLREFVMLHDFTKLTFDKALRYITPLALVFLNSVALSCAWLQSMSELSLERPLQFVTPCIWGGFILVHSLFVAAICRFRNYLWSFRLPGEAQKIDRMMETFAKRFCECNPGLFNSTDTCYILAFAIIMLNTNLHNPAVKSKVCAMFFVCLVVCLDILEKLFLFQLFL
jgi:hypothetical protein